VDTADDAAAVAAAYPHTRFAAAVRTIRGDAAQPGSSARRMANM
jgi:hypothetical protein